MPKQGKQKREQRGTRAGNQGGKGSTKRNQQSGEKHEDTRVEQRRGQRAQAGHGPERGGT
jgi:hypothetical protein